MGKNEIDEEDMIEEGGLQNDLGELEDMDNSFNQGDNYS